MTNMRFCELFIYKISIFTTFGSIISTYSSKKQKIISRNSFHKRSIISKLEMMFTIAGKESNNASCNVNQALLTLGTI